MGVNVDGFKGLKAFDAIDCGGVTVNPRSKSASVGYFGAVATDEEREEMILESIMFWFGTGIDAPPILFLIKCIAVTNPSLFIDPNLEVSTNSLNQKHAYHI
jgi:hypothetical protein